MRFRRYRFSKRYEKLRSELAEMLRLSAATRKREHGEVCNWLLGHAGHIIVEDNSYKAFRGDGSAKPSGDMRRWRYTLNSQARLKAPVCW